MSARRPMSLRRIAGAQHADDAGARDAAMHLAAEFGELGRDQGGGALLLEPDLRMRVKIAPPCRQFVMESTDVVEWSGHGEGLRGESQYRSLLHKNGDFGKREPESAHAVGRERR